MGLVMGEDLGLVDSSNPGFPLYLFSQGHAEIEVKYAELRGEGHHALLPLLITIFVSSG